MTNKARIRVAAAVTALFLAGVSAAGLAVHSDGTAKKSAPAAASQSAASSTAASTPLAPLDDERYRDDVDLEAEGDE
jgi:hypothetical protein